MKKQRAPIVAVLGHVDHGKTTLLDAIRETNVQAREAGGITQGIGATKVVTAEGEITFIDTPGHAAFNKMREQGAKVADIALLAVAADDGVKPQTEEALEYIRKSETPVIVVITKTDLPSAEVERVKGGLEKIGVAFEGRGGDVPCVPVSAKKKEGLEGVLEMIQLVAEVSEIKADPEGELLGVVIETSKDKRGPVALVVVREGKLAVGSEIQAGGVQTKVRGLFDVEGKRVTEVGPGNAALVLGFSELPEVGAEVRAVGQGAQLGGPMERGIKRSQEIGEEEVGIVLKAGSAGALEAIEGSLPERVVVVAAGVGEVVESDIFMAKAAGAVVMVFESKVSASVKKLAEMEGVRIESFRIIYELIDRLEELIEGKSEKVLAEAIILKVFPYDGKRVAGAKIMKGEIAVKDKLIVMREGKRLGEVKVVSMRKGKQEIQSAKAGEECGILFTPSLDFGEGDMIVSVQN